jgi:hypothetical protein
MNNNPEGPKSKQNIPQIGSIQFIESPNCLKFVSVGTLITLVIKISKENRKMRTSR